MQIIKESLGSNTAAYLQGYLREKDPDNPDHVYPAMIVVPGGSYTHIPEQQAETLAMAFANMGYQAFYLRYSFVDEKQPLHPAPLIELAKSMSLLRQKASEWLIDPERIAIAGFSVGGHIAALYNDYWHSQWLTEQAAVTADEIQPQAILLGYPVISQNSAFRLKKAC